MTTEDIVYPTYPHYAVIDGNIISNVVVAESLEHAKVTTGKDCFEIDEDNPAQVGWEYDSVSKKCIVPRTILKVDGVLYYVDYELNQLVAVEEQGDTNGN